MDWYPLFNSLRIALISTFFTFFPNQDITCIIDTCITESIKRTYLDSVF